MPIRFFVPAGVRWFHALALSLAFSVALPASALSPVPSAKPFEPPPLWRPPAVVLASASDQAIELKQALVSVDVFAGQAQTRIELRLFNPNPRVLEGELQFPLQSGQVVTGFALDIDGRLRDAVPVPKAKGQEIFEDIRRRRVDPGLLEATAGNQYKLRVYPIPARGERRVVLTLTETLARQDKDSIVRVPLAFASSVGHLGLRVSIAGATRGDVRLLHAPYGTELASDATGATLHLDKDDWRAPTGPAGWLQLALRQPPRPQIVLGESAGKQFFAGQLAFRDEPVKRPEPRHIALVWDASASAATQSRVLPVLQAYFARLRQPVMVSLLVMRNRPEPLRSLVLAPGRFKELADLLQAEPFDGSSNFDELPVPADADATLMVTDGLMTDGNRLIGYRHSAPVLIVNGAAAADTARLARLADRTGGVLVDATRVSPEEGARMLATQGWRMERLTSLSARKLVAPTSRVVEGRLSVAGELTDTRARIDIAMVHPDGRRRTLVLDVNAAQAGQAARGSWAGRQWASWRGAELAENPALHSRELEQIAAEHGIVGPNSSLIVLELAADYARYKLPAPPELTDEVARLEQQQLAQASQSRQSHLEAMVKQFNVRQTWWDRDFPKEPPPAIAPAARTPSSQGAVGTTAMARPTAPPSPAPAPAPAPAAAVAPSAAPMAAAPMAEASRKKDGAAAPVTPTIALQAWQPDAPYMKRLQDASDADLYRVYLDQRQGWPNSSAFLIDAAGIFFGRGLKDLGLRVLSNLAEMNLENRQLLRLYAYRLLQAKRPDLALPVLQRISELAPNEPQSWRDLGLAFADNQQPQRAVDALWEVVSRPWNARFAGVNMIALAELNALAAQAEAGGKPLDLTRVDTRLRRNLPLALRVVMAWDTDDTDIDLWVTDPFGEKAFYGHRLTYQGGAMSPDATGGYGPEEFALKVAAPGNYGVQAQFYGQRQQVLSAGTTVMVRVTTGFGTPEAHDEWTTLRLTGGSEVAHIANIRVRPAR